MSLFDDVVSQYIDKNGKTVLLNYKSQKYGELTFFISPIPPLNIKIMTVDDIKRGGPQEVVSFIKDKGLAIQEQELTTIIVNGNKTVITKGFWVVPKDSNVGISGGYVPIIISKNSKYKYEGTDVKITDRNDPIGFLKEKSELDNFRKYRKIAEILKQYTLYTYATMEDPETFGDDSFIVDPKHEYNIEGLNKSLYKEGNNIIYREDKIIVNSENIKKGLISYLKVSLLNDRYAVKEFADHKSIDKYYQIISDFRAADGQLVFLNKNGLIRWRNETVKKMSGGAMVSPSPLKDTKDPYYYRNPNIRNNKLMIVQNVKGGKLDRALAVSQKWKESGINIGYELSSRRFVDPEPSSINIDELTYHIYGELGEIELKKGTGKTLFIFKYTAEGEKEEYAAILFFN